MSPVSCGLLMYRWRDGEWSVLLAHPGGPYWARRDDGAWSIPKGLAEPGEDLLSAAQREFKEETGITPHGPFTPLTPLRQPSRKLIHCWAFEGDADAGAIHSVVFEIEWPPRSGHLTAFPEIDRAAWFTRGEALTKIAPGQRGFIDQLAGILRRSAG